MRMPGHINLPGRGRVDYVLERVSVPEKANTDRVTLTVTSGRQTGEVLTSFTTRAGQWVFNVEREALRRAFGVMA